MLIAETSQHESCSQTLNSTAVLDARRARVATNEKVPYVSTSLSGLKTVGHSTDSLKGLIRLLKGLIRSLRAL